MVEDGRLLGIQQGIEQGIKIFICDNLEEGATKGKKICIILKSIVRNEIKKVHLFIKKVYVTSPLHKIK